MNSKKDKVEILKLMNKYVMNISDERAYHRWIVTGPPDCADESDFEFIADNKELFNHCCKMFGDIVKKYEKDGVK